MTPIDQLLIEQACTRLILQAAAHVDAGDASAFAALFAEDGVLQRPSGAPLQGRAAIEGDYAQRSADRITRHLVTNTRFDILAPDRVHARSLVLLWAGSMRDEPGPKGRPALPGSALGEFDDQLVCINGLWLIARREARFVLQDNR
jgi:ketosteroid isomerase-like protein